MSKNPRKQTVNITITRTPGSAIPLTGEPDDDGALYVVACGGKDLVSANFPASLGTVQELFRKAATAAAENEGGRHA